MSKYYRYIVEMELDGVPYLVKGEMSYYPGDPGRLYGRPENCYPPEPDEIDIVSERWYADPNGLEPIEKPRELTEEEDERFYEMVIEDAREDYQADCEAYDEAEYAHYQEMKEYRGWDD